MRKILISGAAAMLLATTTACDPVSIGLAAAGMAVNAMTGSGETAATQAPNIMEALSGLNDQVSESCLAKIDGLESEQDAEPKEVEISTRAGGADDNVAASGENDGDQTAAPEAASDLPEIKEVATQTTLSSETEKVCSLQPVCLPGNDFPVDMMMCTEETVVAGAGAATETSPDTDTTPKEVTWMWSEDDSVEAPVPE
jgi:hypothetical protein